MPPKPALSIKKDEMTAEWVVSGYKTYEWRGITKSLGGKWSPQEKVWRLPLTADITPLQDKMNEYEAYLENLRQEWKKKIPEYGKCCEKSVAGYYYPDDPCSALCYRCPDHGFRWNSKRGNYTGD